MGNVLPAGQGQAPARQASFHAGLDQSVPSTTLNKMCGSGMKCAMVAFDQLKAENGDIIVAGGMESMTNAPYLLEKMRGGARLGHGQVIDHMFLDGLEDAYDKGKLMGHFAEDCAEKFQFTPPVSFSTRKGDVEITADEQPRNARPDKIPQLKPAFKRDGGTVTAANASSISDGAAALVLTRESVAEREGLEVRAIIHGHASHAHEPGWFTTAPVPAAKKLMEKIGWSKDDVDLWEVNEAFAVVPMAFMHEFGLERDVVNVHGGACHKYMELNDKISAVITGGGSGLGEGTARALAALGVKVGIFDVNEEAGQKVADELGGVFAKVDVSDPASVEEGFKKVRAANGQESICVNCAGIAPACKDASQSAAGMCSQDPITEDGERGVIINTASVAAYDGQIGQIAYGSSKAAVAGMTLPMARDLSRNGVAHHDDCARYLWNTDGEGNATRGARCIGCYGAISISLG
ncbi:Acetyl-CoA acetyltransferase, cytosolic 1 [Nymphon striatum]|nr:Acetyl-CoA acetyltransferase, cytosolic 1 [Nymphon striatum]